MRALWFRAANSARSGLCSSNTRRIGWPIRLRLPGQKQADWRTDPARSGSGCVGDIGTHAYQLAHLGPGMMPEEILAETTIFVPGRRVDDNVQILLRYGNGARGALWASQVEPGNEIVL